MSRTKLQFNVTMHMTGTEDVQAALRHLGGRAISAGLRSALGAASRVVLGASRNLAPTGPGPHVFADGSPRPSLKQSLVRKIKTGKGTGYAVIGPQSHMAPHKHLVEEGTDPHYITAGTKTSSSPLHKKMKKSPRRISYSNTGKKVLYSEIEQRSFGTFVRHPGSRPVRFMARAYKQSEKVAFRMFSEKLWLSLAKELGKRSGK